MVICSRTQLLGYKRRAAKAFPKEYLELLFGSEQGGRVTVEHFVTVPQKATKFCVQLKSEHNYEDIIAGAESQLGLDFVGTIHSHTITHEFADIPSYHDNIEARYWDETVFAIDLIQKSSAGRLKHAVSFYRPQQPMHEVAYF